MRADRPSSTALLIARSQLLAAELPEYRPLVAADDLPSLRRIVARCGRAPWFEFALRHRWTTRGLWRIQQTALPGIFLHYFARKQWLAGVVDQALRDGARQLVVLGAGFDLLAWRLHTARPDLLCIELDHPATQRTKAAALAPHGANIHFFPADLAHESPILALQRVPGFDPAQPTCFVAEGLLMYFPAARVAQLLRELAGHPHATLAFSFLKPDAEGRLRFRGEHASVGRWLRRQREQFRWGLEPGELASFLQPLGWQLTALAGAAELRASVLTRVRLEHEPLAVGEYLATATNAR